MNERLRYNAWAGVLIAASAVCGGACAADWPGFLGPRGDGTSPERGMIAPWPEQGLEVLWQAAVGEGYAAPSVVGDRLFIFDRVGDRQRLRCMDAATGAEGWTFAYATDYEDLLGYDGGPRCCPVVDGDCVYVLGPEGMLHCLKIADGSVVWKMDTVARFGVVQNFFGVGSTPIVEGELLIMQVGGSPANSPPDVYAARGELEGNGTGVVALNKKTGEVVYTITNELASYASPVLATIGGRRWCFVLARGGLIGFEPKTGEVDFTMPWRSGKLESVNAANPVVAGDEVVISECYELGSAMVKVRPGGYEMVWHDREKSTRHKSLLAHWATPIHMDGYVYGCSGRHSGGSDLRCVERTTGKVMWRESVNARTSMVLVDGHLLALTEFGRMMLIKPGAEMFELVSDWTPRDAEGDELLPYPAWAGPVVAGGRLYVRGKGRVVCMQLFGEQP